MPLFLTSKEYNLLVKHGYFEKNIVPLNDITMITKEQIEDYECAFANEFLKALENDRNSTEQTKRNYSEQDLPDAKRKEMRPISSKPIGNTAHEIRKGTKNNGQHES